MSSNLRILRIFYSTLRFVRADVKNYTGNNSRITQENVKEILKTCSINNSEDIASVKQNVINLTESFRVKNIDSFILNELFTLKKYNYVLNYIDHLDEDTKTKLKLYLSNQKFKSYYFKKIAENRTLSASEENDLLEEYEQLRKTFPILDSTSIQNCILVLSLTKKWMKCIELLEELHQAAGDPSGRCYSAIISAAFSNNCEEIAWKYFNETFRNNKVIHDEVYLAFFDKLGELKDSKIFISKFEKIFKECNEKNLVFSEKVAKKLNETFSSSTRTSIRKKTSTCENCGTKLDKFAITNETFNNLKQKIIENVIIGKNIFSKTTPEEFEQFKKFVGNLNNYNVIIDGLNVAYSAGTKQPPYVYSTLLLNVVNHFLRQNKKVVVLGRKHMSKWKNWNSIKSNCAQFLTQNLSQDDPYLLYAALHCGKDTIIVTRDLMRSHLFLLKDPNDKIMFSRWLAQRQFQLNYVKNDGQVFFKVPPPYCRIIQKNGANWHIPYNLEQEKCEDPNSWLCIEINNS